MTVDWQRLLAQHDLGLDEDSLVAPPEVIPGLSATLDEGGVIPLLDMGVIRVTGEDAAAFLHSQLTQDIQALDDISWRFAGYCNAKGRLLGLFQVLLSDEGFLLLTNRRLIDSLLQRLRMFVLRAKVNLEDVSNDNAVIGVAGPTALGNLDALVGSIPEQQGRVHRAGDIIVAALGGKPDRLLVLVSADEASEFWETLTKDVTVTHPSLWTLLNIRAGWPEIHPETSEAFVPQQVNLELIEGVNFRKGCYPGQEVVARMHYLGKPSRRMFRLTGPAGPVPAPGTRITLSDGSKAGEVVCAAPGPDGLELLAVLRNEHRDRQNLSVGDVKVGFGSLPYEV